jgi:hypothetical protein
MLTTLKRAFPDWLMLVILGKVLGTLLFFM